MSEYDDTAHDQLAVAPDGDGQEQEPGYDALAEAHHAEHDVDFEQYHHVEFDDGHGGHYEETDITVYHEEDIESDQAQVAQADGYADDGRPHAGFAEAGAQTHTEEHTVGYEHYHHVEYTDAQGRHSEETDFAEFREHEVESDSVATVDAGGPGAGIGPAGSGAGIGYAGSGAGIGYAGSGAGAGPAGSGAGIGYADSGAGAGYADQALRELDSHDVAAFFGADPEEGDRPGGHLGVAPHGTDEWVSN
jgi:hypothetical protein